MQYLNLDIAGTLPEDCFLFSALLTELRGCFRGCFSHRLIVLCNALRAEKLWRRYLTRRKCCGIETAARVANEHLVWLLPNNAVQSVKDSLDAHRLVHTTTYWKTQVRLGETEELVDCARFAPRVKDTADTSNKAQSPVFPACAKKKRSQVRRPAASFGGFLSPSLLCTQNIENLRKPLRFNIFW